MAFPGQPRTVERMTPRYEALDEQGRRITLRVLDDADRDLVRQLEELAEAEAEDEAGIEEVLLGAEPAEGSHDCTDACSDPCASEDEHAGLRAAIQEVLFEESEAWSIGMTILAGELDWVPLWWAEVEGCTHVDVGGECTCGPVDLLEALEHLGAEDAADAVAAHLGALSDVAAHKGALFVLTEGSMCDEVCVGCLSDPEAHDEALEALLGELGRQLGDAYRNRSFSVRVHR